MPEGACSDAQGAVVQPPFLASQFLNREASHCRRARGVADAPGRCSEARVGARDTFTRGTATAVIENYENYESCMDHDRPLTPPLLRLGRVS